MLTRMNKNAMYTNSQRRTIDADSIRLGRNTTRARHYSNMDVRQSTKDEEDGDRMS